MKAAARAASDGDEQRRKKIVNAARAAFHMKAQKRGILSRLAAEHQAQCSSAERGIQKIAPQMAARLQ
jgi:hypothetical protein